MLPSLRQFILFLLLFTVACADGANLPTLTTIRQIHDLAPEEAAKGYPVAIRGVITYREANQWLTFVQDETGGVYVYGEPLVQPGDLVEIEGVTRRGIRSNQLGGRTERRPAVRVLGRAPMPVPASWDEIDLTHAAIDAQWLVVNGVVSTVGQELDRASVTIDTPRGQVRAYLAGLSWPATLPTHLLGLKVSARGVGGSKSGKVFRMYIPSEAHIEIDPEALEQRFGVQEGYPGQVPHDHPDPVRFKGVVLYALPGAGFFLNFTAGTGETNRVIWVQTSQSRDIGPGSHLEVVGRYGILRNCLMFYDAGFRILGTKPLPNPITLHPPWRSDVYWNGQLIDTEATLVAHQSAPWGHTWAVRIGGELGYVRAPKDGLLPKFAENSRVHLTGVLVNSAIPGFDVAPGVYQILLLDVKDARLISLPTWWTVPRITAALFGVAGIAIAAIVWSVLLRRRVQQQTRIIRDQLADSMLHEERTRIARELHDTLDQHLVGLTMQVNAAELSLPREAAPVREMLQTAKWMARQSRDEARQAIWEMRMATGPTKTFANLLHDALLRIEQCGGPEVSVQIEGEDRVLPEAVGHHLSRVAIEAVRNAVEYAQAKHVTLRVHYKPDRVTLHVEDDGCGFDIGSSGKPGGHFGILGMRERAEKLNGVFSLRTAPGQGTCVSVEVPLCEFTPTRTEPASQEGALVETS